MAWKIYRAIDEGRAPAKRPVGSKDLPILWNILDRCWSTDPSERPTANAFLKYLDGTRHAMEIRLSIIDQDLADTMDDSDMNLF